MFEFTNHLLYHLTGGNVFDVEPPVCWRLFNASQAPECLRLASVCGNEADLVVLPLQPAVLASKRPSPGAAKPTAIRYPKPASNKDSIVADPSLPSCTPPSMPDLSLAPGAVIILFWIEGSVHCQVGFFRSVTDET
jgi:hypothetical protein